MHRIRISLAKQKYQQYQNLDLIHDALINALIHAGAKAELLIGENAAPWNFSALGWHRKGFNHVHSLVVSTTSPELAATFQHLEPQNICKMQRATGESISFAGAQIKVENHPVFPDTQHLSVLMLSPLVIRQRGTKKWHRNMQEVDLSAAINFRLSRLADRTIQLNIQADALYLRANPQHSLLVPIKRYANGKQGFVIGMNAPLLLSGKADDLRFAWYAGIGEKNRNGFGCIGLAEQGVGR